MCKAAREVIAAEVVGWWNASAVPFLSADNWSFAVNKKGKYLPGKSTNPAPEEFNHELGAWSLTLRTLSKVERIPHRQLELTNAREALHKVVTIVLMNLVGSATAGKLLAPSRAAHGLPKLRKADIWGKQLLLF